MIVFFCRLIPIGECLVIDDGSTDGSDKICDKYAKRDMRIRVFHKENGGLSSARNYAMERASGDLITFVDSDDYLKVETYESMIALMEKYNADIVMCNYLSERGNAGPLDGTGIQTMTGAEITEKILSR